MQHRAPVSGRAGGPRRSLPGRAWGLQRPRACLETEAALLDKSEIEALLMERKVSDDSQGARDAEEYKSGELENKVIK